MANQEELKRRIEALIQKGGQVLATSRKLSSKSSARILDASAFNDWKTQSLSFLMQLRGADEVYTTRFEKEVHDRYESDVKSGIGILKALYEDIDFTSQVLYNAPSAQTNNVFVVHGHDEEMKQAVARTLSRLGLQPIILHEQTNQGKTLIEKFERSADVPFAVILLSPDDMGYVKTASSSLPKPGPGKTLFLNSATSSGNSPESACLHLNVKVIWNYQMISLAWFTRPMMPLDIGALNWSGS